MESKYYRKLDNSNPLIGQENQFYKRKEILKEIVEFNNQEKQIRKKIANKETSSKQFNYSLPYLNLNYKESFLDDLTNKRDLQYFGKLENRNKKIFENVENYNYYISKNQNDSEFNKKFARKANERNKWK